MLFSTEASDGLGEFPAGHLYECSEQDEHGRLARCHFDVCSSVPTGFAVRTAGKRLLGLRDERIGGYHLSLSLTWLSLEPQPDF